MEQDSTVKAATRNIVQELIATRYPHLQLPAVAYASVVSRRELALPWYEYTLQVLDRVGTPDDSYPPLPGVRAKTKLEIGTTVAVGLPYGELTAVILGEVWL